VNRFGQNSGHVSAALSQSKDDPAHAVLSEPLFTPKEVADALKMSADYVRRLFEREPGVVFLPSPGKASHRRYRTMRIPKSVLNRVCSLCVESTRLSRRGAGV
jgi:hypothetical protein